MSDGYSHEELSEQKLNHSLKMKSPNVNLAGMDSLLSGYHAGMDSLLSGYHAGMDSLLSGYHAGIDSLLSGYHAGMDSLLSGYHAGMDSLLSGYHAGMDSLLSGYHAGMDSLLSGYHAGIDSLLCRYHRGTRSNWHWHCPLSTADRLCHTASFQPPVIHDRGRSINLETDPDSRYFRRKSCKQDFQ